MTNTYCIECKSEVPDASELCPECGFPAQSGMVSCPECLHPVLLSLDACPECGFPLDELRESQTAAEEPAALPAETAPSAETASPAQTAPAADNLDAPPAPQLPPKESHAISKIDPGEAGTNQVLQAQIDSFNELTAALGKMTDNGDNGTINDLVASIANFVASAENNNNEMLADLITGIQNFVESSEKIKDDMLNKMKEQNLITISSMQEVVNSFSGQAKAAAEGIKEAQKAVVAEMNGIAQQVKDAATKESAPAASSDYLLYICIIVLLFTSLNFVITAYVVKLIK